MIQFQLTYCYVQFSTFVGQIQDSMCGKAKRMNYSLDLLYLVVVVENNIECIFDFSTSCNEDCR